MSRSTPTDADIPAPTSREDAEYDAMLVAPDEHPWSPAEVDYYSDLEADRYERRLGL